jgi:hypothetical protein
MSTPFESGFDLVEILGEFIGDEYAGDDFVGDDFVGDDLIGAILSNRLQRGNTRPVGSRSAPQRRPMPGQRRPMPMQRPNQNAALMNAIAERRAMAGALLHDRSPTKSREYPLGFASLTAIAAGASARITARPQVPFRIDRLVVPSDLAGLFTIDDVKVGKNSQFAAEGSLPARIFQENAVGVCLKGDTAQISMDVTLNVTNISGAAAFFRAGIIGPAVE